MGEIVRDAGASTWAAEIIEQMARVRQRMQRLRQDRGVGAESGVHEKRSVRGVAGD